MLFRFVETSTQIVASPTSASWYRWGVVMPTLKKSIGFVVTVVSAALPATTRGGGGVIICLVALLWSLGATKRVRWVSILLAQHSIDRLEWSDRSNGVRSALDGTGSAALTWAAAVAQFGIDEPLARGLVVVLAAGAALTMAVRGTALATKAALPRIRDNLGILQGALHAIDQAFNRAEPTFKQLSAGDNIVFYEVVMTTAVAVVGVASLVVWTSQDGGGLEVVGVPGSITSSPVTTTTTTTTIPIDTSSPETGETPTTGTTPADEFTAEELCGEDPFILVSEWLGDRDSTDLVRQYTGFGAAIAGCPSRLLLNDDETVVIGMSFQDGKQGALLWSPIRSGVLLPTAAEVVARTVGLSNLSWATPRMRAYTAAMHVVGLPTGSCELFFRPDPEIDYVEVPGAATAELLARLRPGEVPQRIEVDGNRYTFTVISFPGVSERSITTGGANELDDTSASAYDPVGCPGLHQMELAIAALPPAA